MNALRRYIVCSLALLAPVVGSAETLEDAWRHALEADRVLQAHEIRDTAREASLDAARAARLPTLTLATEASRWRDTPAFELGVVPGALPLFDGRSTTMSQVSLTYPLYSGRSIAANVTAAAASLDASRAARGTLVQTRKLEVAAAYVEVLRAESALDVARANAASLAAHSRDVADLERGGIVARNDALAAAVALADAEQRSLAAENALAVARAAYNRALGRPLSAAVVVEPAMPRVPAVAAVDAADEQAALQALVDRALATRGELAQLDAAADGLAAQAEAARAPTRPQVFLTGGYTAIDNEVLNRDDFWSLAVGVRWSLFDGGRSKSTASALARESEAVALDRAELAAQIELEVRRAWLELVSSRARLAVMEGAIAQAEENLRVVRDRYRNGEGTNTEVLDAEALRSLTRGNLADARFDAAMAEYRLARAVGVL